MKNYKEVKKAVGISVVALALGTTMALGIEWEYNYRNNNRIVTQEEKIIITKPYSPFSYLELTHEKGKIKEISQKNSLTNKGVLRFKLNNLGKVEEMVKDSSFIGNTNPMAYYPDKHKTIDWDCANQIAQKYIHFFKENKNNPYQKL